MGITGSKSPLERRNTVARRSQRRVIHNIKAKVERVCQDIKKFKGTEEDENFNGLLSEIEHLKIELMRKSKDLQPQVRNIYEVTFTKLEDSVLVLENKLLENREKFRKKDEADQEKNRKKEEKNKLKNHDDVDEVNDIIITEEENEADELAAISEKRKTLEVKFVQIIPPNEDSEPFEHHERSSKVVSPEDKRKSILKVGGVPVMPRAMINELSSKSKKLSDDYHKNDYIEKTDEDPIARVKEIIDQLQDIECQIADFVGRKFGTQYNRIRDQLNEYLNELNEMNPTDEIGAEQVTLCRNYISSNITFLDEKAVNDNRYASNDDVFLPDNNNVPLSPIKAQEKFERLTKTTAI